MILSENDDDLKLRPRRAEEAGGEWDAVRSLPVKVRRRLVGAGLMGVRGAYAPDQLAETLNDRYGTDLDVCEAIRLWVRESLRLLAERRREARRRRELRLARRHGCATFHEYRALIYSRRCWAPSVHAHCVAMGWR